MSTSSSQVEYVRDKKIHILYHGMMQTLLRNPDVDAREALTAFLLSGGAFPKPQAGRPFVLLEEQLEEAREFLSPPTRPATVPPQLPGTSPSGSPGKLSPGASAASPVEATAVVSKSPSLSPPAQQTPSKPVGPVSLNWAAPQANGVAPFARAGHGCCVAEGKVWVVGGNLSGNFSSDVFVFDLAFGLWEAPPTTGTLPSPRAGHTLVHFGGRLFLFGGADTSRSYYNDCYCLNIETLVWEKLSPRGTAGLAPRAGHSAAVVGHQMFVFGGEDLNACLSDMWSLDLEAMQWTRIPSVGASPAPRGGHSCAVRLGRELWIFGGDDRNNYLGDLHLFDTETKVWTRVHAQGEPPLPRGGHCCCVNPSGTLMVIFGGTSDSGFLNDLAVMSLEECEWKPVRVSGAVPSPCSGHTGVAVDPGTMVVFGGYDPSGFRDSVFTLALP